MCLGRDATRHRWDEWVHPSRLLKFTDTNVELQKTLSQVLEAQRMGITVTYSYILLCDGAFSVLSISGAKLLEDCK